MISNQLFVAEGENIKTLTVFETPDCRIGAIISEKLREIKNRDGTAPNITVGGRKALENNAPDLLVISPKIARQWEKGHVARCKILLAPGKNPNIQNIDSQVLVSYGMSAKDSITLSSIDNDRMFLTIQREIPMVDGGIFDRQELPLRSADRSSPEDNMAAAAALLIMGIPPEKLKL